MKKNILRFFSILCIFTLMTSKVYAVSLVQAGETIVQEGDYDSIRLLAGNTVTNKANVDGISLVAGNEVLVEGSSSYGVYAGNNVSISEKVLKDMFVAGNKIIISENAEIGRDAFIAGSNVTVLGNVGRDLRIGASTVNLMGITVNGDAYLMASEIFLDDDTVIVGKLIYPEDAKISGLNSANIGSVETTKSTKVEVHYNFYDRARDFIFGIVSSFVVLLILLYLLPKANDKIVKKELAVDKEFKTMAIGFLELVTVPFVILIGLFTYILMPAALILLCVYFIGIYLSSLLSSYIIGNVLMKKLFHIDSKYLAILVGIVLVKLLKLIPMVGPLFGFICMIYGMGLIFIYIRSRGK